MSIYGVPFQLARCYKTKGYERKIEQRIYLCAIAGYVPHVSRLARDPTRLWSEVGIVVWFVTPNKVPEACYNVSDVAHRKDCIGVIISTQPQVTTGSLPRSKGQCGGHKRAQVGTVDVAPPYTPATKTFALPKRFSNSSSCRLIIFFSRPIRRSFASRSKRRILNILVFGAETEVSADRVASMICVM